MNPVKKTYRAISIGLAFLMLVTSAGISIDVHYCKNQLKSFSLLGKAKSCHQQADSMKNCPHHQKMMLENKDWTEEKNDCCENKTVYTQSDQDQQLQDIHINELKPITSYGLVSSIFDLNASEAINKEHLRPFDYKSPQITRDIYALTETFLL